MHNAIGHLEKARTALAARIGIDDFDWSKCKDLLDAISDELGRLQPDLPHARPAPIKG